MSVPVCGRNPALGIFRVEPRFDRMPAQLEILLGKRQRLAGRDPELPFDEVEPGHRLGDRVFDLQPRIHLDEIEAGGHRR